jgi:3D (Asp-Asp-Asp) domain-containing protein
MASFNNLTGVLGKLGDALGTIAAKDDGTIRQLLNQVALDLQKGRLSAIEDLFASLQTTPTAPDPKTAKFVGLTAENRLAFFNPDHLSHATVVDVTGLQPDETLLGVDFRPNTGELFALGSSNRLYIIDPATGIATQVGSEPFAVALEGENFGFDFNPTVDRIRVVSDAGQNLRLNPDTGAVVDANPAMAGIQADGNLNGDTESIVATAYTNSFTGTTTTTQYGIDALSNRLFIQAPPNEGTQNFVGELGFDFDAGTGFDILFIDEQNLGFATSGSSLLSIDLETGTATLVGEVKAEGKPLELVGFAGRSPIMKPDPASAELIGLTDANHLVFFNSNALNNVTQVEVTGLQPCEMLRAIDIRPETGELFALGNDRIYTIDRLTGMATQVGTGPFAVPLDGTNFGFDFNPTVDRIRVVSDAGQNLRLNPDTGAVVDADPLTGGVQPDGNLNGDTESIVATAYTNSFVGSTTTTQYGIDALSKQLFIQAPPNQGTQNVVGDLGFNFDAGTGFDIVFREGMNLGFATSNSSLFSIDLDSGAASLIGEVRDGATPVNLVGFTAAM